MALANLPEPQHFIEEIIADDLNNNRRSGRVATRFPPEPNGYLHIGHAKSICLNFGVARKYGGTTNLRFDDTNPAKEEVEFVESIREDVRWLGFDWEEREFFASDYYQQCYEFAEKLICRGKAYICHLSGDQVSKYRGMPQSPGTPSPWRDRPLEESLDLFRRMRAGEFEEGACFLRAKIDMASPNMNLRDPAIYRIKKAVHHRTGTRWVVYPMYDYAHPLGDWMERITHSICTLEFESHRPLYDWVLQELELPDAPRQIEFARLNLSYTVMSKRKLLELVQGGFVHGWDDPRMPTISGLRRRGYTPSSIREFCDRIGVAKTDSMVDINLLYFCLREELNRTAPRAMAVLDPLKLVITDWPESKVDWLEAENIPEESTAGHRLVPFTRELWIERDDFMENPPKKYFRLAPGAEVRLKHAYYVRCQEVIKDAHGNVVEVHCTHDPQSRGGGGADGRKVKGTIHWVSVHHAFAAEVRLFNHLFKLENTAAVPPEENWLNYVDNNSCTIVRRAMLEPSLAGARAGQRYQFLRHGYFFADPKDSKPGTPVFHRTVELKDSWAKANKD